MTQVTPQQRANHVIESLFRETSEQHLFWKVVQTDGAKYGRYRTSFRNYDIQAEYRTGQKAFNEVSILLDGEWLPLGIDTEPVLKLLPLLQATELEMLIVDLFPEIARNCAF